MYDFKQTDGELLNNSPIFDSRSGALSLTKAPLNHKAVKLGNKLSCPNPHHCQLKFNYLVPYKVGIDLPTVGFFSITDSEI